MCAAWVAWLQVWYKVCLLRLPFFTLLSPLSCLHPVHTLPPRRPSPHKHTHPPSTRTPRYTLTSPPKVHHHTPNPQPSLLHHGPRIPLQCRRCHCPGAPPQVLFRSHYRVLRQPL